MLYQFLADYFKIEKAYVIFQTAQTSEISLTGCRFVVMKERTANLNDDEVALHVGDVVQAIQSGKVKIFHLCALLIKCGFSMETWKQPTQISKICHVNGSENLRASHSVMFLFCHFQNPLKC